MSYGWRRAGTSQCDLITSATVGSLEGVRLALLAGVDPSARLADEVGGFTALHAASEAGHEDIVCALLDARADPSAASTAGDTPLKHASCEGHVRVASWLLAAGATCNVRGHNGEDALMEAAARGHAEMTALLLAHGAHADSRDQQGRTALCHALGAGSRDCVHALLRAGAPADRTAAISALVSGDIGLFELVVAATTAGRRADTLARAAVVLDLTRMCSPSQLLQLLWICQPRPPETLCASLSAAARAAVRDRTWNDATRRFYPPSLRRAVAACACLATRREAADNPFQLLAGNVLGLVMEHVAAAWVSTDVLDPGNAAFLRSLGVDPSAPRRAADQRARGGGTALPASPSAVDGPRRIEAAVCPGPVPVRVDHSALVAARPHNHMMRGSAGFSAAASAWDLFD